MIAILLFVVVSATVAIWWLSRQGLTSKPWLEVGAGAPLPEDRSVPTAKFGLGVFLFVVAGLFALLFSAYFMRMELPDWQSLPLPRLLWLTTGLLVLSSLALHFAVQAARADDLPATRLGIVAGGISSFAFLVGQLLVWQQLMAQGHANTVNPANSFFYLTTGLHGLHILGGLVALGKTASRAYGTVAFDKLRHSVELCAIYWHFLLVVWLLVFAVLAGWADNIVAVCSQLLS